MAASIDQFIEERIEQDVSNWEAFEDIYAAYVDFCTEVGLPAAAKEGLGKKISQGLEFEVAHSRRIPEGDDRQKRGYVGLRLLEAEND